MKLKQNLKENYNPLYFLASLGSGGLSVSVFIYFMFMLDHPKTPLATYDDVFPLLMKGNMVSFLIAFALVFIIYFAYMHIRLLVWNIKEYNLFKKTDAFEKLRNSNAEVSLMAIPLTYAMTINVGFVLGAVFVPGLWSVVEYLFPFAIIGFLAVGFYGLKIFTEYFTRIITKGDFDFVQNSNLSQMVAIFAFSMVAVGLAAPGAMSHHIEVSAVGIFFSIFFASIAVSLLFLKIILGFKSMFRHGVKPEMSASLWITIPILTLLGITAIRLTFGLVHNFDQEPSPSSLFMLTSIVLSLQLLTGIIGYQVMKNVGYFKNYVSGEEKHVGSFALICPGVAFFVFGMFFITFGLLKNNILEIFSIPYFIILLPFVYVQIITIKTYFRLNYKLLADK